LVGFYAKDGYFPRTKNKDVDERIRKRIAKRAEPENSTKKKNRYQVFYEES